MRVERSGLRPHCAGCAELVGSWPITGARGLHAAASNSGQGVRDGLGPEIAYVWTPRAKDRAGRRGQLDPSYQPPIPTALRIK